MNKYDKAALKLIEIFNSLKLGIDVSSKEFIVCNHTLQELIEKEKPKKLVKYNDYSNE